MVDPISAAAAFFADKLAAPILLSVLNSTHRTIKNLSQETKQLLYRASNGYYKQFRERHGILKVLGMSRPTSLDDIYVKVRLLDRNSIRMFESIDKIEETFRSANRRLLGQVDCKTTLGYKIANDEQYLMILGGPGAGKSTFLRKMGMEALQYTQEQGFHHECIPVFVELKQFKELPIDIESHIAKEFENCGFPKPKEFAETALKQGKLLVLLDGLDEVPTANRSEAVTQIQNFVDRYSHNRFIASCRQAAYNQNFRRFTDVGVAEFDDEQIRDFINNWFGKGSSRAKACWEEVSNAESVGVKELAQTPLLLTLVCLLFEKGGELPVRRATLYDRALRVLLEEWNASKELERDKPYKGLDTRAKELLLATIAFDFFEEDRLFFPRRELARKIETVLKDEILPDEKRVDGDVVLKAIEVQHGILAERSTNIYSFSHLTLQEFLAAVQISDNPQKHLYKVIDEHLLKPRWQEVFLLLVGTRQSDDILLAMEQQVKGIVNSPRLYQLINWANEITEGSFGSYPSAAKRGLAMCIACDLSPKEIPNPLYISFSLAPKLSRFLDRSLSFSCSLSGSLSPESILLFSRTLSDIYEELQLFNKKASLTSILRDVETLSCQIPKRKLEYDELKNYTSKLISIWISALNLDRKWICLSEDDIEELRKYLYASQLLLDCRNAAVRLSRKVREGIVDRMLTL